MQSLVTISERGQVFQRRLPVRQTAGGYEVLYAGQWRPARYKDYCLSLPAGVSRPAGNGRQRPTAGSGQQQAAAATYEQWLRRECKAPAGLGTEWQARRKCEAAIDRMRRYRDSNAYQRRLHAGSHDYRYAREMHKARIEVWNECIETATAVCAGDGPGVTWVAKWDIIRDIMTYSTEVFSTYGL